MVITNRRHRRVLLEVFGLKSEVMEVRSVLTSGRADEISKDLSSWSRHG